jgi:cell wall-associated NlpC family hydrolase
MKILNTTILILLFIFGVTLISKKKASVIKEPVTESYAVTTNIGQRDSVISYAKKYIGTPYVYAAASPNKGFDCSGFVNYVYKHFGITVPRSSVGFKDLGRALKPSEFKVGDVLVFYGYRNSNSVGHVGIISEANGMKSKFIHASSGKEMAVTISELSSSAYTKRFYKCVNVLQ